MKVSIITTVLNGAGTFEHCIKSVLNQTYRNIEYIVIDGKSSDETLRIINKYHDRISHFLSEPDDGMWDALNKGLDIATGDIIGLLHSDDFYTHNKVIATVVSHIEKHHVDSCYGDLMYVKKNNPEKVFRYWKSSHYSEGLCQRGWVPPHPTLFIKKDVYTEYGYFNTKFKLASDYDLMLRFLERYRISSVYIPEVLVKMRTGGMNNKNLKNRIEKTFEDFRSCRENGIKNVFSAIVRKKTMKIPQFFKKRYKTNSADAYFFQNEY
jgi:glycosyltransferase